MRKLISAITSAIVGVALAALAAWGVVSSNTAAPAHNPASIQQVNYGQR